MFSLVAMFKQIFDICYQLQCLKFYVMVSYKPDYVELLELFNIANFVWINSLQSDIRKPLTKDK